METVHEPCHPAREPRRQGPSLSLARDGRQGRHGGHRVCIPGGSGRSRHRNGKIPSLSVLLCFFFDSSTSLALFSISLSHPTSPDGPPKCQVNQRIPFRSKNSSIWGYPWPMSLSPLAPKESTASPNPPSTPANSSGASCKRSRKSGVPHHISSPPSSNAASPSWDSTAPSPSATFSQLWAPTCPIQLGFHGQASTAGISLPPVETYMAPTRFTWKASITSAFSDTSLELGWDHSLDFKPPISPLAHPRPTPLLPYSFRFKACVTTMSRFRRDDSPHFYCFSSRGTLFRLPVCPVIHAIRDLFMMLLIDDTTLTLALMRLFFFLFVLVLFFGIDGYDFLPVYTR